MLDTIDAAMILWAFGCVQIAGLVTAWIARISEGSATQLLFQRLFLLFLLANGLATMYAMQMGAGYWLSSAATLGVMVLAAVCDFRQADRAFTI